MSKICEMCQGEDGLHDDSCPVMVLQSYRNNFNEHAALDPFELHERLRNEGVCPKGCGQMSVVDEKTMKCKACKFEFWSATPRKSYIKD